MCGDATNKADVERLMHNDQATLCFTSPPYLDQRTYVRGAPSNWDALMQGVFSVIRMTDDGQILVNLGQVIRKNEVVPYEQPFIEWMKANGWRFFDEYVWDKGTGKPFIPNRLIRQHEYIYHFNKQSMKPHKTVAKKDANIVRRPEGHTFKMRMRDGTMQPRVGGNPDACLVTHKQASSVFNVSPMGDRDRRKIHPAVFPLELCEKIIPIWSKRGDVLYEPFSGSGTMILAAENLQRRCYAMEIETQYVEHSMAFIERHLGIKAVLMTDV
jgi:DNA modification methylase